jgi:hypothetical protein
MLVSLLEFIFLIAYRCVFLLCVFLLSELVPVQFLRGCVLSIWANSCPDHLLSSYARSATTKPRRGLTQDAGVQSISLVAVVGGSHPWSVRVQAAAWTSEVMECVLLSICMFLRQFYRWTGHEPSSGFFGHDGTYTVSFCVFGPVLSSPAHGAPSLAMEQIGIEVVWIL